jgi:threonine synthase
MDVGDPSNFERMLWLYGGDREAMREDITGSRHTDEEVRATIRRVYDERGYLLDPHSAIAYRGLTEHLGRVSHGGRMGQGGRMGRVGQVGQVGIFLATAHPAKFREVVEPVVGRAIETPGPLADALARPRHILRIDASLDALVAALGA